MTDREIAVSTLHGYQLTAIKREGTLDQRLIIKVLSDRVYVRTFNGRINIYGLEDIPTLIKMLTMIDERYNQVHSSRELIAKDKGQYLDCNSCGEISCVFLEENEGLCCGCSDTEIGHYCHDCVSDYASNVYDQVKGEKENS